VLAEDALSELPSLKSLTFESGSKLSEIHGRAFVSCGLLKTLLLPASVSHISDTAFMNSSFEEIHVDDANPNYFVSGQFLICVAGMTLFVYFGDGKDLEMDSLRDSGGLFSRMHIAC
jgi:hypothetical protein